MEILKLKNEQKKLQEELEQNEQENKIIERKYAEEISNLEQKVEQQNRTFTFMLKNPTNHNRCEKILKEPKNEMTSEEQDKNVPLNLNVVVQTKFRATNGFEYLETSFKDFEKKFSSIGFKLNFYAFSPKLLGNETKPNINSPNFKFVQIDSKYLKKNLGGLKAQFPKSLRERKILSQSINFVQVLSTFKNTVGKPGEVFLFMEDDFTICENSIVQLASIYLWALKHRSSYRVVRVGIGLSGVFLKYDLIEEMVRVAIVGSIQRIYPIDYTMAVWWCDYISNNFQHYVFKYNIFYHIGHASSVGNANDHSYNLYKCYDGNYQNYNFYLEKFDTQRCSNYILSPCNQPELQADLKNVNLDGLQTRSILRYEEKMLLMSKLGISINTGFSSCSSVCQLNNRTCDAAILPFVNDCETIEKTGKQCRGCYSFIWSFYDKRLPLRNQFGVCVYSDFPDFRCGEISNSDLTRICACRK